MAPANEAECLLCTGAAYLRRIGLRPPTGDLIFAGFKPGAFSLYFGDLPAYHFDLDGRWQRALIDGIHWLRHLDGTIESIDRVRQGAGLVLNRRRLDFAEAADLDASIQAMALDLIEGLVTSRFTIEPPPEGVTPLTEADLRDFLDRVAGWDAAAWFRHREAYTRTYGPWPFLPPGVPHPIVLQTSVGDPDGRRLGGGSPSEFASRTPTEFRSHVEDVARLLGRRAALARGVFLAGSDLLHRPIDQIGELFEIAAARFPITGGETRRPRLSARAEDAPHLDGFYVCLDDPTPPLPDASGWAHLKDQHLRRVDVAVQSGDPAVRLGLDADWADQCLIELVSACKAAGIALSLILLVGAGGLEGAHRHVDASVRLLERLDLGRDDLVYLIDIEEVAGASARETLARQGLTPLDDAAREAQGESLRQALQPLRTARGVKVVRYSLEKQ